MFMCVYVATVTDLLCGGKISVQDKSFTACMKKDSGNK